MLSEAALIKSARIRPKRHEVLMPADRAKFWAYCVQAESGARARARNRGVPFEIGAHAIDELLVQQGWRCAVSGLPLQSPKSGEDFRRNPFSPSLDRIVPANGYVLGNVRVVCNMVNIGINEWGLDNLLILLDAITKHRAAKPSQVLGSSKPVSHFSTMSRRPT